MMDQHAYLEMGDSENAGAGRLRPGDMIGFDISHPCLTFDKWRVLPILDREYNVVDLVQTYF
jgi:D-serine dehydratase